MDEKILVNLEDDEPKITTSQKILYILYGVLFSLVVLNFFKYVGYWPYKFHLEVITEPGVDVTYSSTNDLLEVEHVVIKPNESINPKLLALK